MDEKSILKYVKYCLKTKNSGLKTQIKRPLISRVLWFTPLYLLSPGLVKSYHINPLLLL